MEKLDIQQARKMIATTRNPQVYMFVESIENFVPINTEVALLQMNASTFAKVKVRKIGRKILIS